MHTRATSDRTWPDSACFWSITLTWPFYIFGALYVVGPLLAWILFGAVLVSTYLNPLQQADLPLLFRLPPIVWCWIVSCVCLLVIIWVGHANWDLGIAQTIKSSFGWAKGWALIAIFILAGSVLKISAQSLVRAQAIQGGVTLIVLPLLLIAPMLGLPQKLYTSPLEIIGGPGPEYFSVYLYTIDPATMAPRWQFYAPWAPFAGLLGVTLALFSFEDKHPFWKYVGTLGGISMIAFSQSRMSIISLVICFIFPRMLVRLKDPFWLLILAVIILLAGIFEPMLKELIAANVDNFNGARAASSRVRETLQSIAFYRWHTEAYWWGHGTVERGPHLVEFMPIGSHHTWYALLYVKGALGFATFLIPFLWHCLLATKDAVLSPRGRLPMALLLNLVILTFGENIEIEAYLLWPIFVMLGIHCREVYQSQLNRISNPREFSKTVTMLHHRSV